MRGYEKMPYRPITAEELEKKTRSIFEKYNIKKAEVFGSCAKNEMKRGSDIDLLIEFDNLENPLQIVEIKRKIENIIRRKVHLITYSSLDHSPFREKILSETKVIYEKY